ncbi:MAG: hypothetical protein ACK4E7_04565 [Permianibacter sp.]
MKQFTRLGPVFYVQGSLYSHYTNWKQTSPVDYFNWHGECAGEARSTFEYFDEIIRDAVFVIDVSASYSPPIAGHFDYVKEEHSYRYLNHKSGGYGCPPMDGYYYYGRMLKVEPIQCPVGYRPYSVRVSGVPFQDVCRPFEWKDYSIYKESVTCPVAPLTPIEELTPNDADSLAKTRALERGESAYDLLSDNMKAAEQCLSAKFAAKGACYRIESTYRSLAYQKHLREIWDKWRAVQKLNKKERLACSAIKSALDLEMGGTSGNPRNLPCNLQGGRNHCIRAQPASANPKHTQGDAIDISDACVTELENSLNANDMCVPIESYLTEEPRCNVKWGGGGNFHPIDTVHFKYDAPPPQPDTGNDSTAPELEE